MKFAGEKRMRKQYLWGQRWSSEYLVQSVPLAPGDKSIFKSILRKSVKV
jgi:hypothetical protein